MRVLLPLLASIGLGAGCYTSGDVGASYSVGYAAPAPDLYYMSPGVSVVAYSDDPVFYSDNYYWRYDNGLWYQSSYYNGGWAAAYNVPYNVRRIDRPTSYARFQPGVGWSRAPAPRYYGNRGGNPNYNRGYNQSYSGRDHRAAPTYNAPRTYSAPGTYNAPAPAARDHRSAPPATYRAPAPAPAPTRSAPPARDHRR